MSWLAANFTTQQHPLVEAMRAQVGLGWGWAGLVGRTAQYGLLLNACPLIPVFQSCSCLL